MPTRWTTPIIAITTLLCWQTPATAAMPGDPTNDGATLTNDIICVARLVAEFDVAITPCANAPAAADVDCNGVTNTADIILTARLVAGLGLSAAADGDGDNVHQQCDCDDTDNSVWKACADCPDGAQDNDDDGVCQPSCASENPNCPANSHCDDGDGTAQCVCDTPEDITTQTSGPVYYLSPDGDDLNDGSESNPWKTILTSLAKVDPGSTLKLSAGKFRLMSESSGLANVFLGPDHSGAENAPKLIQGKGAGQTIITGAIPDFEKPNQKAWVLVDEVRQIYRSKDPIESYYPPNYFTKFDWQNPTHLWGYDEDDYSLIGYRVYESFAADNVLFKVDETAEPLVAPGTYPLYVGPGTYLAADNDGGLQAGHIYIRLSITQPEKHGVVQRDLNPNLRALRIFDEVNTRIVSKSSAHLEFADLSFNAMGSLHLGAAKVDEGETPVPTHHWTLRRVQSLIPEWTVRDGGHDVAFFHSTFSSGFPPWTYRSDVKYLYTGPTKLHPPANSMHIATVNFIEKAHDISMRWCHVKDSWFGVATVEAYDVDISQNQFQHQTNDALIVSSPAYKTHVHHNVIQGWSGVSWGQLGLKIKGSDEELKTPAEEPGTVYVHHNLIQSEKTPISRPAAPNSLGYSPSSPGLAKDPKEFTKNRPFASHGYHQEPWNTYNNTIVMENILGMTALTLSPKESVYTKYFLNNVVIQENPLGRFIYGKERGPRFGKGHGLQIADGNVYWRPPSDDPLKEPHYWLLYFYKDGVVDSDGLPVPDVQSFMTLDVLKSDTLYEMTKLTYSYGFDGRSVFADPQLGEDFRPADGSPAVTAQIDLSTEYPNWPHNDSTYIGAYPPAGAPIECLP